MYFPGTPPTPRAEPCDARFRWGALLRNDLHTVTAFGRLALLHGLALCRAWSGNTLFRVFPGVMEH